MTTTPPDGIYYIEVVGSGQPQYLTREKGSDAAVTILPPSAKPDPAQEWRVLNVDNGNIIIEVPDFVPGDYLTYYKGDYKKPERGDYIICRPDQRPPNEWQFVSGNIRIVGSDLGIALAGPPVYPPILALEDEERQLKWSFVNRIDK